MYSGGALIEATVDTYMSKFPTLEAGFMVVGIVMDKGCIMVAAGPPDLSVGDDNLLFLSQGG